MTDRSTASIKSLWPPQLAEEGAHPDPIVLGPVVAIGPEGVRAAVLPRPGETLPGDPACLLVRHPAGSFVVVLPGHADEVSLDRRPIPGGVGRALPGRRLRVGDRRYWLSSEGPARVVPAAIGAEDAWTLDPLAPGTPVVQCDCTASYGLEVWAAQRRCVVCGTREDGEYRHRPPESGR